MAQDPRVRLAVLDVGQGSCAVLYGGKSSVMFDCPPGSTVPKFLRIRGVASIDHLVLSHADKDHAGGVRALIASGVAVGKVWILDDQVNETSHYRGIARAFAEARSRGARGITRGMPHSDLEPTMWGEFAIDWLGPNHEDRMLRGERNGLSVVARLVIGERGLVLFPGDLDHRGYARLDPNRTWQADWLIAPHHGGFTGTPIQTVDLIRSLLGRTGASHILFSFAREGRWEFPKPGVLEAARSEGVRVVCTQLAKRCSELLPQYRQKSGLPAAGARRSPLSCCAGTVLIELNHGDVQWVGEGSHVEFVRSLGGTCCSDAVRES